MRSRCATALLNRGSAGSERANPAWTMSGEATRASTSVLSSKFDWATSLGPSWKRVYKPVQADLLTWRYLRNRYEQQLNESKETQETYRQKSLRSILVQAEDFSNKTSTLARAGATIWSRISSTNDISSSDGTGKSINSLSNICCIAITVPFNFHLFCHISLTPVNVVVLVKL